MRTFKIQQQGFSLLEVLMSIGLAGLVTMALYTLWVGSNQQITNMEKEIENYTDLESGQRIMLRDLKNVDPTFGAISLKDDNGHPMFEYYPDVPEDTLKKKYGAEAKCPAAYPLCRVYTLRAKGNAEIVFLMHDPTAHEIPSLVYDPTWAHQQAQNPTSKYLDGTLTFLHVNQKSPGGPIIIGHYGSPGEGYRGHQQSGPPSKRVDTHTGYWKKDALLMFDTPTTYRSESMINPEDEPPRPAFFVGQVTTTEARAPFIALDPSKVFTYAFDGVNIVQSNLLDRRHPVSHSLTIDSVENFFRWIPPSGGGQPLIRLRPVRLVKYTVELMYPTISPTTKDPEEIKKKDLLRVWRHIYTNGWDRRRNRFIVAENVRSIQFRRNSITEKAIIFNVSRTEL